MILSDHERRKFADYCRIMADSANLIAEQLEKMPGMDKLASRERLKYLAYDIVAKDIMTGEVQTILSTESL